MAFLLLIHAGLALLAVLTRFVTPSIRARAVAVLAAVGAGAGVLLMLAGEGQTWRTTTLDSGMGVVAGAATAVSWLLVIVLDRAQGRWEVAAAVGVAGTGLGLFATGRWLVPALMFWMCSSLAIAVLCWAGGVRGWGLAAITTSDALLVAVLVTIALQTSEWGMPSGLSGWELYALVGAVGLRCGALPRIGVWALLGTPAAPALPLLVGGSFALLAGPVGRPDPTAALLALSIAVACAAGSIGLRKISPTFTGAWPVALALGVGLVATRDAPSAALAAILAMGAVAVWPLATGRARVERALLLAFPPATAGFGAITAAAAVAFERARVGSFSTSLGWILVAGVLPVALVAGVVMAVRVGRQTRPDDFEPAAVVATWGLLGASLVVGVIAPGSTGAGLDPLGPSGRVAVLFMLALVAGYAARRILPLTAPPLDAAESTFEVVAPPGGARTQTGLAALGATLGLGSIVATVWVTIEGLSVGFL